MEVSSPDKLLFPADGITKAEVVDYYESVADRILPHLEGRPLTLQRFPSGIEAEGFMQKNAGRYFPDSIERVEVPKEGGTTNHPLVDTTEDLLYLVNQNTITFHVWTSRQPHLDRPDRIVLDLDPSDEDGPPRDAARAARELMQEAGLDPGLMTTGSRGYHVVAQIEPSHDFDQVGRWARQLAGIIAARHPETTTTEFLKKKRGGRVFVDWLRNRWAQSVVAAWSLRPRPGAPVATPIGWEELDSTDPDRWTIRDASDREEISWPPPATVDGAKIEELAETHGVDVEEPFDRFGRNT
ncbi:MAG TPA: non-homologous end-joining DNA ligase [Acidimicrobiia bacterium]|nr:non-homologous end-joining DNA ligase [Acidimicrobiia bacterium]